MLLRRIVQANGHCRRIGQCVPSRSIVPLGANVGLHHAPHVNAMAEQASFRLNGGLRSFSAATGDQKTSESDEEALQAKERSMLRKFQGASTFLGIGAIAWGSWWSISQAMYMVGTVYAKPHLVAYAGFWFGFSTAWVCAALATAVYRLTFIRPEFAYSNTMDILRQNSKVQELLGSKIRDGKLKSYEIKDGRFQFGGAVPTWLPHKIQMMYIIYGEKGMGLVTTVCVKKPSLLPRKLEPDLLSVDVLDDSKAGKPAETIVIAGDEKQLKVRDNIHRLLDIKMNFSMGKKVSDDAE